MADTNASYVQVAPDGGGKKVRNISADVVQSDGTIQTVQMQVVAVVDHDGRALDLAGDRQVDLLRQIVLEVQALRKIMGRATGQHWVAVEAMGDDF